MQWSDYKETAHHQRFGIGILKDHGYVITQQKGSGMNTYFYPISKKTYDCFETWKDDEEKVASYYQTTPLYIGYFMTNEFRKYEKKNR